MPKREWNGYLVMENQKLRWKDNSHTYGGLSFDVGETSTLRGFYPELFQWQAFLKMDDCVRLLNRENGERMTKFHSRQCCFPMTSQWMRSKNETLVPLAIFASSINNNNDFFSLTRFEENISRICNAYITWITFVPWKRFRDLLETVPSFHENVPLFWLLFLSDMKSFRRTQPTDGICQ